MTDFFERWRLERMVTWDLPDPVSFHAPDRRDRPADWPEDRQVVTISGLIPLKQSDHRIPDWMDRDNRSWRSERGLGNINRQSKQFQNIALLRFFELAVEARVKVTQTTPLSQTDRYAILGKLLNGKNEGHVRKILRFQNRLMNRPI